MVCFVLWESISQKYTPLDKLQTCGSASRGCGGGVSQGNAAMFILYG
ncbi:MAG: hypothetical protein KA101_01970 [Saprospiraceae bacterium]|nr:hypothetical protein [Saprospiraceae bacterium]